MTTISSSGRKKKVLPSLLSSSRLLTFSWCVYVEFSPSVSAEAAAQTQAAILYSAASNRTHLARHIQEVWRFVFQNKSATPTHARKKKKKTALRIANLLTTTKLGLIYISNNQTKMCMAHVVG